MFITRTLAASAALVLAAAAHAQPAVSPFTLLPGDRTPGAAEAHQQYPTSCRGGEHTLVVWLDQTEIRAARLDADGDVVDTSPIVVARDRTVNASLPRPASAPPGVAWNGQHWLIVYPGNTTSLSGLYTTTYIFGVRIAPDGTIIDQTPITIRRSEDIDPNSNIEPGSPTVAAGPDGNWAVSWSETASTYNNVVRAHLLSPAGEVVTPQAITLTSLAQFADAGLPRLIGTDDGYLITYLSGTLYNENHDIFTRRLTPTLGFASAPFNVGSGDSRRHVRAEVVRGPSEILIAAHASDNGVYGFRLARSGTAGPINTAGINLAPPDPSRREYGIAPDGTNWALAYTSEANFGSSTILRFRRFLPTLAPSDPAPLAVPLNPNYGDVQFYRSAAVAELIGDGSGGGGVEVLWHDNAVPADDNVWGSRVPPGAAPLPRELVSIEIPTQAPGGIATRPDGSGLLVFFSGTAESQNIKAQRFGPTGAILDAEPMTVATYTFPESTAAPAVAFNGSVYMIVWPSGSKAWARRMNHDGTFLDPAPVPVLPVNSVEVVNMLGVNVAAIGDTFLVAGDSSQSFNRPYVRFARVRGSDMTVLDPTGPVIDFHISQLGDFSTPAITPVGLPGSEVFLLAYTDKPQAGPTNIDIEMISPDGTRAHASYIAAEGSSTPTAASIGDRALVAWRGPGADPDIYGRFFLPTGVPESGEFLILSAPGTQTSPRLAADDDNFLLAWSDFRHVAGENPLDPAFSDPWAARLDASGTSLDGSGFPLRISPTSELNIRLAPQGPGGDRYIAMYSALTPESPTVYRAGTQLIGEGVGGCPADWTGDGIVTSSDISAYLTAWLQSLQAGTLAADFNADGAVNSSDISAYLTSWLQAVQTGC